VIKNIANPSNLVLVILPVHTTYEDGMECSETSAHKIQALGNHPKERIQHSQHGESLKLRILRVMCMGVKYRLPPPPPQGEKVGVFLPPGGKRKKFWEKEEKKKKGKKKQKKNSQTGKILK